MIARAVTAVVDVVHRDVHEFGTQSLVNMLSIALLGAAAEAISALDHSVAVAATLLVLASAVSTTDSYVAVTALRAYERECLRARGRECVA